MGLLRETRRSRRGFEDGVEGVEEMLASTLSAVGVGMTGMFDESTNVRTCTDSMKHGFAEQILPAATVLIAAHTHSLFLLRAVSLFR